jgi:hypothetical protein
MTSSMLEYSTGSNYPHSSRPVCGGVEVRTHFSPAHVESLKGLGSTVKTTSLPAKLDVALPTADRQIR